MLKKFMAALLAVCLLLTTLPTAMLAGEGEGDSGGETPLSMEVTAISQYEDEVYQGEKTFFVSFTFNIGITEQGQSFQPGQTVSVSTNLGEYFDAEWATDLSGIEVKDKSDIVVGTISVTEGQITFTVGDAISGKDSLTGIKVSLRDALTAKNVGATSEQSVTRTIKIDEQPFNVTFLYKETSTTPEPGLPGVPDPVDINQLWKNADSNEDYSGSWTTIEVNPIGSMDLYGSTTFPEDYPYNNGVRKPTTYDKFIVEDTIPEHGFIDQSTIMIYAAIPAIAKSEEDSIANTWYPVPKGTYYAKRQDTDRRRIEKHMTKLEPKYDEGETLEQFRKRIAEKDLNWGIYRDKENTETFLCNFGHIGDPDSSKNNGINYSDYRTDLVEKYPKIFGEQGASGGNIVSYYIEFDAYYPDIVGIKSDVVNRAGWSANNGKNYGGNDSAKYTIDNTKSTGVARQNELIIKVVDEDDQSIPIQGATFVVQQKNVQGEWEDTRFTGTTDKDGRLVFEHFLQGDYRLRQTGTADNYSYTNNNFGESGNDRVNNLDRTTGTFSISNQDFGFGTIITNRRENVNVTFMMNDGTDAVHGTVTVKRDEAVGSNWPTNPTRFGYDFVKWTENADGSGAEFTAETVVNADKVVYAQWKEMDAITLTPEDQTIYTGGDGGSGTNSEFPHPIYLLGGKVLDENTIFYVNGKPYEGYPFTVKYYDGDEEIKDDQRYGDYTARIVPVDDSFTLTDITTSTGQSLNFGEGTLRIRYVSSFTEASANALTSDAVLYTDESDQATARDKVEATDKAGVILPESSKIYLNGNKNYGYSADGPGKIALLFDELLPASAGGDSTDLVDDLIDRAAEEGYNIQDSNTMFRYLDLVDTNDSNAWVSSSEGSDVFWPYPEGCDRNDDIQLLHFTDLHREYRMTGEAPLAEQIAASDVENVSIEKTANGIWFHVAESGFSPFALVWDEKNDHPHWPPVGPGDDDDDPSEDPEEPDTPALDKVNHFLYVEGYPEDYRTGEYSDNEDLWPVKPQGNITRAEVATIFYRLLKDEVREEIETDVNSFPDVNEDDWFNVTVSSLANMGAISGYEDGAFRPNEPISRAELAAMAVRFYDTFEAEYEEGTFLDVDGDEWYADAIAAAEELGIIGGYPDGTVRPNNNITRAETCAIVNRVLERRPHDEHLGDVDDMRTWPDNQPGAWYYADMQEATNGHYYEWIDIDGSKFEEWTEVDKDYDWTKR